MSKKPGAVADVDVELDRITVQLMAAASEQASSQASIDGLLDALRVAIENGDDTSEIEAQIVTARVGLDRLALRHSMLERVAREKGAALREKRHRLRVEALEAAEAGDRAELAMLDAELVEDLIGVAEKFSRREQRAYNISVTSGRLQHLTGLPRGTGDLEWTEARLRAEFLRRHPEAARPMSFGDRACGEFVLTLPVVAPDRTVAALVADDEAASK